MRPALEDLEKLSRAYSVSRLIRILLSRRRREKKEAGKWFSKGGIWRDFSGLLKFSGMKEADVLEFT